MSLAPTCLPEARTSCLYQPRLPRRSTLRPFQPPGCRLLLLQSPQSPATGNILWRPIQLSQEVQVKGRCAGSRGRHLRLPASLIHFSFSLRRLLNRTARQVLMDLKKPNQVHQLPLASVSLSPEYSFPIHAKQCAWRSEARIPIRPESKHRSYPKEVDKPAAQPFRIGSVVLPPVARCRE